MKEKSVTNYCKALGSKILGEANDLKRTPEALANELGISIKEIEKVINGESGIETALDIMKKMADKYPISLADLWLEQDDTNDGVRIIRVNDSKDSSRIFKRKDINGGVSPYYEYRDTAMSSNAPFKPEWIQPIRIVKDEDPYNENVVYNNGHLMHQATFFIGKVNFYWKIKEKKYCSKMNTGDSNFITPFTPHSFTSRDYNDLGLIIAVTYSNQVRAAINDFARMDNREVEKLAGNISTQKNLYASRLNRYMSAEFLTQDMLSKLLTEQGVSEKQAGLLTSAEIIPDEEELEIISGILGVRKSELLIESFDESEQVVVSFKKDTDARYFPDEKEPAYSLLPLAHSKSQPGMRSTLLTVLTDSQSRDSELQHGLHQYIYNYGEVPVRMYWNENMETVLEPGDSAYVQPMVKHGFNNITIDIDGKLLVIRVPGKLTDQVLDEFSTFAPEGRNRVLGESRKWF